MAVVTVSTVLDTAPHVTDFVERNLRSGADHMVIFLDADVPEVREALAGHPHVTLVVTDDTYWKGRTPDSLNMRQRINANLARVLLLGTVPGAWLFHIDADECLDISRERLEALGPDQDVVALNVMEAVSSDSATAAGLYKRQLTDDELALLFVLGHIERPTNRAFFRGYVTGKAGARVGWGRAFRTHDVVDDSGEVIRGIRDRELNVLHDESTSLEEFVDKWRRFRGTKAAFRRGRELTWSAVGAVVENPALGQEQAERLLTDLYHRRVADPVDVLRDLGYARPPEPARHAYSPQGLAEGQQSDLDALLGVLLKGRVDVFRPRRGDEPQRQRLRRAAERLSRTDRDLAQRIQDAAQTRHRGGWRRAIGRNMSRSISD